MADELTVSAKLNFTKGGVSVALGKTGLQVDVAGDEFTHLIQTIGTTEESLNLGDVSSPGFCILVNLDSTNFVELRPGSAKDDMIKLKPGEVAMFRLATSTPYAIADTGACRVQFIVFED